VSAVILLEHEGSGPITGFQCYEFEKHYHPVSLLLGGGGTGEGK
jgi:hypothetical protein